MFVRMWSNVISTLHLNSFTSPFTTLLAALLLVRPTFAFAHHPTSYAGFELHEKLSALTRPFLHSASSLILIYTIRASLFKMMARCYTTRLSLVWHRQNTVFTAGIRQSHVELCSFIACVLVFFLSLFFLPCLST